MGKVETADEVIAGNDEPRRVDAENRCKSGFLLQLYHSPTPERKKKISTPRLPMRTNPYQELLRGTAMWNNMTMMMAKPIS